MQNEYTLFQEMIKGHNLLVTSKIIQFKGNTIDVNSINNISTEVFTRIVNRIVSRSSTKKIIIGNDEIDIAIECFKWKPFSDYGEAQFNRLYNIISKNIGQELIRNAFLDIVNGKIIEFSRDQAFLEKGSKILLSKSGLKIQQEGLFGQGNLEIPWPKLLVRKYNGEWTFSSYEKNGKLSIKIWHLRNNHVFTNLLDLIISSGNYRHFN